MKKEVIPVTWPMQVHYFYTMKKHIKTPEEESAALVDCWGCLIALRSL